MSLHIKKDGVWHTAKELHIKKDGVWYKSKSFSIKQNGAWKTETWPEPAVEEIDLGWLTQSTAPGGGVHHGK